MTKEANLWSWLSKARRTFGDDLHMQRVENAVGPGTPDVEGHLLLGRQFWIELKTAVAPARPSTPVRFKCRPAQTEWLEKRWKSGGSAFMLLQVDDRRYLVPGWLAGRVEAGLTLDDLQAACVVLARLGPSRHTAAQVVRIAASAQRPSI